jgi:uncharacterized membrane protein
MQLFHSMMNNDRFWLTKAAFEGGLSQTFLAISGVTGTGSDPSLVANSAFRLAVTCNSGSTFKRSP